MFQPKFSKFVAFFLFLILAFSVSAQTKRKTSKKKTVKKTVPAKTETVVEDEPTTTTVEIKKNARPDGENLQTSVEKTTDTVKTNSRPVAKIENPPVYFYDFSQPNFFISKISIEHDENGKGKVTFLKKDFEEPETEPLQLSPATLEKVKTTWSALNFLDSTENYQFEKDFSHLGTMKFTMKKDGRMRESSFNWTENKDAKNLANEYRRIGQQFIWIFDINVARENQPLDAPRLLESLDSMVKRNEISDAAQMLPLLKELNNDERIPLIARNRAMKLVEKIEKDKSKK